MLLLIFNFIVMKKSIVYLITIPGNPGTSPQQFVFDYLNELILFVEESKLTNYLVQSITKIDYSNAENNENASD